MKKFGPRCSKCGGDKKVIKDGISKNGNQRYKCKQCGVRFQLHYRYVAYKPSINHDVKCLLKEGLGIRSIGRILSISPSTVISRILKLAERIKPPQIRTHKEYELDEM